MHGNWYIIIEYLYVYSNEQVGMFASKKQKIIRKTLTITVYSTRKK